MSSPGKIVMAIVALATVSALGACGEKESGTPSASAGDSGGLDTNAPTTGAESSVPGEAPRVTNPLDATSLVSQPCDALSSQDREQLGFTEGSMRPMNVTDSMACSWNLTDENLNQVHLSVVTENPDGLDTVYRNQSQNAYFEPTSIAGYPGVYTGIVDSRDTGSCDLWIGVNDQVTLFVMASLEHGDASTESCTTASEVGEAVIANLGG